MIRWLAVAGLPGLGAGAGAAGSTRKSIALAAGALWCVGGVEARETR